MSFLRLHYYSRASPESVVGRYQHFVPDKDAVCHRQRGSLLSVGVRRKACVREERSDEFPIIFCSLLRGTDI